MLTRGQAANRLGVSIAAVRRFEGNRLHPVMRSGRWMFDPDEVEELAQLRASGGGRLTFPADNDGDMEVQPLEAPLNDEMRHAPEDEEHARSAQTNLEAAGIDAAIADATVEILEMLSSLSSRERIRFLVENPEICRVPAVRKALSFDERLRLEEARIRAIEARINGGDSAENVLIAGAVAIGVGALGLYAYKGWIQSKQPKQEP